jgi:hypothetical protein
MREAIEQRRRHLGIAEDGGPFAKGEVGGDDDGGLLVEPADQMEGERPPDRAKGRLEYPRSN